MAVTDTLRDAAYITVGAGVLGFQKAQVRRHELARQLQAQRTLLEAQLAEGRRSLAGLATQIDGLATQIDGLVAPVRTEVAARIDAVEVTLPDAVRDVVTQVRSTLLASERAARARFGMRPAA